MKDESPWELAPFSSRQKEDQCDGEKVGSFASLFPKECNRTIASCIHGGLERDCGTPIYDEYEDDYWDNMHRETIVDHVGIGLNRERYEVSKVRTSPYVLNLRAPY